jgi:phosphoadenosine phosphosulfate reductase
MFIEQINNDYAARTSEELLSMTLEKFSKITLACSFGAEDIVLLDMIMKINPNIDIFYLDTHLHFKETYETIELLEKHYQKKFIKVQPKLTLIEQVAQYGEELWSTNANACCNLRKVDP